MTTPEPATDDGVLYRIEDVARSFRLGRNEIAVLRGITFDVRAGEFLAIRGSSGAGKSTLLHLLGLLDRPSRGSLRYRGRDLARAPESERTRLRATDFGFVFQFYYLLPEFTALENVVMPSLIARAPMDGGGAARKERARELLGRVGLSHRLDHRPNQLSGGERQRVAIARALMNRPRIVFCDEPTGNLDSKTAAGIHALLLDLNLGLGQTMVVVTHEEVMAKVARRQLVMVDGRIVGAPEPEAGPPDGGGPGSEPADGAVPEAEA